MWRKYKEKEREKERKGWRMGSRAAARKGMKEKSGHSFWAKYIGQVRVTFDRIWMQSGIPDLEEGANNLLIISILRNVRPALLSEKDKGHKVFLPDMHPPCTLSASKRR
jgi:hypothetical protein